MYLPVTDTSTPTGSKTSRWRPWDPAAYAVLARGGLVRVEPTPRLVPRQARPLDALIDDLLSYQSVYRRMPRMPDGPRALRAQARTIADRLAELAAVGVHVRWRPGADGTAMHLLCRL